MAYKSGFVTVIGRPNVGKSTLLNSILGQKIAITSDKPQTTRKRIKGVYTTEKGQIVFIDTPGIHKPLYKLGEFLLEEAKIAIPDADVVLFLVDGTEPAGLGDKWIVQNLLGIDNPIILVINKLDEIKNMQKRDENIQTYKQLFGDKSIPVVKISAKTGRNKDTLIDNIYRKLPKGPQYYPEDIVTDQKTREITEEIIREKLIINTEEEIPHGVAVVIDLFEDKESIIKISATIYTEHESQKGIIIGNQGQMIKKIGSQARIEIEEMVDKKVFLELFVKVKKDWRKSADALKGFGFSKNNC
ncbi:MAG: GTPase Era [Candidatus Gastranaerophilaceae bacterium]